MDDTAQAAQTTAPASSGEPAPLHKRVISSSVWSIVGYGASQVLRLLANLVFAHLLFPEAFGVLGLVNIFVQGLAMFSDIGLGPSIIQSRRGEDPRFLDTAWTIQVGRGFMLWLVSVAAALPFARLYDEPRLASLLPVAALSAVLSGFSSTKLFTGSRRLQLARITVLEFVTQTLGLVVMVVWCWLSPSMWAIVFGTLVSAVAKTVLSHTALHGERNRFAYDREAAREIFRFGRWIFVSTSLTFLALQVDRLLLGKFVPMGQLGIYSLATNLASLAPMVASTLAMSVLFPLLAHHSRTDMSASERALVSARSLILRGGMFVLAGVALLSPAFFRTLYDARYADGTWMAPLLTVPMWTWLLMISADRAVLAVGDSKTLALANASSLIGKVAGCFAGFALGGVPGFILGLAVGNLAGHVPILLALRRMGLHILRQDLAHTAVAGAGVGCCVLLQHGLLSGLESRALSAAEIGIALLFLVPMGIHVAKLARQVMARR